MLKEFFFILNAFNRKISVIGKKINNEAGLNNTEMEKVKLESFILSLRANIKDKTMKNNSGIV